MNKTLGSLEEAYRHVDAIRHSLDDKNIAKPDVYANKINKFVQQLENISNNASIMSNDVDYDIPIELLSYIDNGTLEVNPERFQYELFHSTEESSEQLANKLLKLKELNNKVTSVLASSNKDAK